MKVCIDIQAAVSQQSGIGRYTRSLAQHLGAAAQDDDLTLFSFDFMRKGSPLAAPNATQRTVRWCPGRAAQLAWKTCHWPPFQWLAGKADVYHFPNFVIPPLSHGKAAVTIHDVSFLRYPQFAETRNLAYLSTSIERTVRAADAVLTISHFSADEIAAHLPISKDRIFVVYPGISPEFSPVAKRDAEPVLRAMGITQPYLLTVGTLEPRKNIPFLIDVFDAMEGYPGKLVIVGARGWKYGPILEKIHSARRAEDIVLVEKAPDSGLPALYSAADLFVFPSLYEGFGFPPLEAMACGTPVVSSTGGSLPEVLADAAVLVPHYDTQGWVNVIKDLLANSDRRTLLTRKGVAHAARYTWEHAAAQTWEVYRSVSNLEPVASGHLRVERGDT